MCLRNKGVVLPLSFSFLLTVSKAANSSADSGWKGAPAAAPSRGVRPAKALAGFPTRAPTPLPF